MTAMKRAERRYTPRRKPAAVAGDAVQKEAKQLTRQAELRLRLSGAALAEKFERLPQDPVARFAAVLDIADDAAVRLPPAVVANTLPCSEWWRGRLADLRAGRTREDRIEGGE